MRTITRITAIVFLLAGALMILAGILFALFGGSLLKDTVNEVLPNFSLILLLGRSVLGAAIAIQALPLIALGEGLWMISALDEKLERNNRLVSALGRRLG